MVFGVYVCCNLGPIIYVCESSLTENKPYTKLVMAIAHSFDRLRSGPEAQCRWSLLSDSRNAITLETVDTPYGTRKVRINFIQENSVRLSKKRKSP